MQMEEALPWPSAGVLSGVLESALAVTGLVYWYSHSVTTWAANALDSALRNGPEAQVPGQAIGFSALVLWLIHPVTWFVGFFAIEGVVRMLAAVSTEQVHGMLPLVVLDWCYGKLTKRRPEGDALHTPSGKQYLRSFACAVRDKVAITRSAKLADELVEMADEEGAMLEIRAARPKTDWDPPRVVKIGEQYYRLQEVAAGKAPRPFVFRLRRLDAGVPGRRVICYEGPRPSVGTDAESE